MCEDLDREWGGKKCGFVPARLGIDMAQNLFLRGKEQL
jgi:hypothetical protein